MCRGEVSVQQKRADAKEGHAGLLAQNVSDWNNTLYAVQMEMECLVWVGKKKKIGPKSVQK